MSRRSKIEAPPWDVTPKTALPPPQRDDKPLTTRELRMLAYLPTSYSKVSAWKKCPLQAHYRYVEKRREPPSPAMQRGNEVHKVLEDWALASFPQLPAVSKIFQREAKTREFAAMKDVIVERMWSFGAQLEPVAYKSPSEFFRVKCDLAFPSFKPRPLVVDHKTGKVYPEHREQGELYGAAALAMLPKAEAVEVEFWYIDQARILELTVHRSQAPKIAAKLRADVEEMINSEPVPKPSPLCRWCGYSKTKGGPCLAG